MLFLYEKLNQISSEELLKSWKEKFGKDKPQGFKKDYLYWPNNHDDNTIITLFYELYNIDNNVIKTAKSFSQKRDTVAHVSDMSSSLNDVDNFLDDILKLLEKFQKAHKCILDKHDCKLIDQNIISNRYSRKDIQYLIDKLIKIFGDSASFNESAKLIKVILNTKNHLGRSQIENILKVTMENSKNYQYHQILETGKTSNFFSEIYQIYGEPSDEWKVFAAFVDNDCKKRQREDLLPEYNWLFEDLGMTTYTKAEEEIDLDEIPF